MGLGNVDVVIRLAKYVVVLAAGEPSLTLFLSGTSAPQKPPVPTPPYYHRISLLLRGGRGCCLSPGDPSSSNKMQQQLYFCPRYCFPMTSLRLLSFFILVRSYARHG